MKIMPLARRHFLALGAVSTARPATSSSAAEQDRTVSLVADGVKLSPRQYGQLLVKLAEQKTIVPDSYSREGAVAELEQRMASLLGKESAVFLPTGTLANHLAVRELARGGKVLVQHESHLYNDEGDCAQRLSSLNVIPLGHGKASFTLADVEESVERAAGGRVDAPVGAISIESPVRRKSGELFPFGEMRKISAYAKQRGIGMHLDGARLFLASPYSGVTPAQYAEVFDTVYVSLYKYFNAGFGAILAGPRRLLENLYHARRMFGGGLPHVWPEAVVAQHFLDGFEGRFARAVANADALFGKLAVRKGFEVQRVAPGSNLATLKLPVASASAFEARLKSQGVTIAAPLPLPGEARVQVLLATNETILRREPEELAKLIFESAAATG